jgi:hypothetical protein
VSRFRGCCGSPLLLRSTVTARLIRPAQSAPILALRSSPCSRGAFLWGFRPSYDSAAGSLSLAAMGVRGKLLDAGRHFPRQSRRIGIAVAIFYLCRDTIRPARRFSSPMRRSCSAAAGVLPATLSGVAEGSEGGCNSELGFCGISGKSGGRVGGLTGGGSFWALWPFGWGIASVLKTLRLTGSNLVCSDEVLGVLVG